MSPQDMARHALQAVLSRVIGSFGDSVKYYFHAKNRIIQFLQLLIYAVLFYHIFFVFFPRFTTPRPSHLPRRLVGIIASLAGLPKACKTEYKFIHH